MTLLPDRLRLPLRSDAAALAAEVTAFGGPGRHLRLSDPHAVADRGAAARVHLVSEARVDPWIEALLAEAAAASA